MADQSQDEKDDAPVAPSIHPATRALYIRDLTRPLHENAFKSHITTLASHPSNPSSEDPIQSFYLDSVKSHALIVFKTLTTATRVRVGIHSKIWPNERTRKPLWADFIPEGKVAGWVERERRRGSGGRWEVVYIQDRDEDGGIRVELEEVGASGRNPGVEVFGAPTGPRRDRRDSSMFFSFFFSISSLLSPFLYLFPPHVTDIDMRSSQTIVIAGTRHQNAQSCEGS
jgi:hypothetical protein